MKGLVTVITPTFNRGKLLLNCYESLIRQTNKNFEWIIVDDGSIDETESIVNDISLDKLLSIKYFKKENGGKHTALNEGIKIASGEITLILDSDDILIEDCISNVINEWEKYRENTTLCGMSFLKMYLNEDIIGDKFPKDNLVTSYIECRMNGHIKGDKCEVFLTKVLKDHPFPEFENEKFLQEHIIWAKLGKKFNMVHINKAIYIAEYLDGGLTNLGRKIIIDNPLGAMNAANECVTKEFKFKIKFKNSLLYNTYSIFLDEKWKITYEESNNKTFCLSTRVFSYFLYFYWKCKYIN